MLDQKYYLQDSIYHHIHGTTLSRPQTTRGKILLSLKFLLQGVLTLAFIIAVLVIFPLL